MELQAGVAGRRRSRLRSARGRQRLAGTVAEKAIELPRRDIRVSDKNAAKDNRELAQARAIKDAADHPDAGGAG